MCLKLPLCGDNNEIVFICTAGRKSRYNCGPSSSRDLNRSIIFIVYVLFFFLSDGLFDMGKFLLLWLLNNKRAD